jgi:energy-coupling factor transport system permease protein
VEIFSPKAKILLYIFLVIAVFVSGSFKMSLLLLFSVTAFAIRVPLSVLKRGLIPVLLFLTFTFISNVVFQEGKVIYEIFSLPITEDGLRRAGQLTLRLFILILGAKVLTATTKAEDLIIGMNRLLGPVGKLSFVNELVHTMSLTLRLLPIIYKEALDLYKSVKNSQGRGLTGKIKLSVELLTPLFERSLKKAKEMSKSEERFGN